MTIESASTRILAGAAIPTILNGPCGALSCVLKDSFEVLGAIPTAVLPTTKSHSALQETLPLERLQTCRSPTGIRR